MTPSASHEVPNRVFHGPVNIAGIGGYLANWQRQNGIDSDHVVLHGAPTHDNYHVCLNIRSYGRFRRYLLQLAFAAFAILRYEIFHFYFGQSLLPYNLDLPLLRLLQKKIVMTYCGSDVRLIEVEARNNAFVHLIQVEATRNHRRFDASKKRMLRWHGRWIHRAFVCRELWDSVRTVIDERKLIKDIWIHNVGCDSRECVDPGAITTRVRPQILHAPSNRDNKGTSYILDALIVLRDRGVAFDYVEVSNVPNTEVKRLLHECDILVDSVLYGGIGTLAFEGMCYGKPVVCYVQQHVIDRDMPDCPVWNANVENLADRLEILIRDAELRVELGRRGISFVQKYLDFGSIQNAVLDVYQAL